MPTLDEILELLHRAGDEAREQLHHVQAKLEAEELDQLIPRISYTIHEYYLSLVDAVTAGGTLPGIPTLGRGSHLPPARPSPPPIPPTFWERLSKQARDRPYLSALLAGVPISLITVSLAAHFNPGFRNRLFGQLPFLKPVYLKVARKKHQHAVASRPRTSPDGKTRLETVIVIGCDARSYGREVARAYERKGFIVIASVSCIEQVEDLERAGNGYIKAIVLDPQDPASTTSFVRSLSTALSLRYPLKSAGDPFNHTSGSISGLQLSSVVNCLPISSAPATPQPFEALASDAVLGTLNALVHTPLNLLKSLLPLLRASHDPSGSPATIITCLPAAERYLGTPFSGSEGALRGIASNSLAQAMDVMRREISVVQSSSKRPISIVNLDVGFLQRLSKSGKKHSRGVPMPSKASTVTAQDVERGLPSHLRSIYAPALISNIDVAAGEVVRRRLPSVEVLCEKLLSISLAKKASRLSDRYSVGSGVATYYLASLLPISFVDTFFSIRQRLLTSTMLRNGIQASGSAAASARASVESLEKTPKPQRRPLPTPPASTSSEPSSGLSDIEQLPSEEEGASQTRSQPTRSQQGDDETDTIEQQPDLKLAGSDVILPTAPSEAASTQASGISTPVDEGRADGSASDSSRSTMMGESYVQV